MTLKATCEACEKSYKVDELIWVEYIKQWLCHSCVNQYIDDIIYDRDKYRKSLDNVRIATLEYLQ